LQVECYTPTIIEPPGLPRSEGIHESAVLKNIAVLNGALDKKYLESVDLIEREGSNWWNTLDEPTKLRMSIGLAWEEWYVRTQLPHVVHQPGELCCEGLFMTPDGESLEAVFRDGAVAGHELALHELALHEVKTTSKSLNTVGEDLRTQWMWLTQAKTLCKGLGATLAFLHVLFLQGDYTYPLRQAKRVYKIRFTELEIEDNWEMVTSYVNHRIAQEREDMMRDTQ
jgi:hypothetical protein